MTATPTFQYYLRKTDRFIATVTFPQRPLKPLLVGGVTFSDLRRRMVRLVLTGRGSQELGGCVSAARVFDASLDAVRALDGAIDRIKGDRSQTLAAYDHEGRATVRLSRRELSR